MPDFRVPEPSKQVHLHQLLVAARRNVLHDVIRAAAAELDPTTLGSQLSKFGDKETRKILAGVGIRDEEVLATPILLIHRPSSLGYYRLLLGVSQKQFYAGSTGLSRFKRMEERNDLPARVAAEIPDLCRALNLAVAELVAQLSPSISKADVEQLPLLTLGSQLDGSYRNKIGQAATEQVFLAIAAALGKKATLETDKRLKVINASGRTITIELASDPDVVIREHFADHVELKVAIEIKGGTDKSNAHNRAGEAEKSHQKVKGAATDFWTLIATKGLDLAKLKLESPTTKTWFDVSEVLAQVDPAWTMFRSKLASAVGVAL